MALRLCMERIAPAPKDIHVSFTLPEMNTALDASQAAVSLFTAVSEENLTPMLWGLLIATDALLSYLR